MSHQKFLDKKIDILKEALSFKQTALANTTVGKQERELREKEIKEIEIMTKM